MNREPRIQVKPDDQRNYHRISAIYPLEFWVPGIGTGGTGKTRDLSAGGIQFLAAQALLPGTELRVRISAGRDGRPSLDFPASVVRCTPRGRTAFAISCSLD